MPIALIHPRNVVVSLQSRKKGAAYQVDKAIRPFLEERGWIVQKVARSYATVTPPHGTQSPFEFNVDIPTPDQVVTVAQETHARKEPWAGKLGDWVAIYLPSQVWTETRIDPFTAQAISRPEEGGTIPASFYVGIRLLWHAGVWFQDGEARYFESESQASASEPTSGFISPDEVSDDVQLVEGASCRITVNAYERNPEARRKCIEAHGACCCICGFNFGDAYGLEVEGYIHVHHLKPLSEIGNAYVVDPIKDLRPVCPNCHAVLHLDGRCRAIAEVQQSIQRQRQMQVTEAHRELDRVQ